MAFQKGNVPWNKGSKGLFNHTEESKIKIGDSHRGEKSPGWKGENVGYRGSHYWVYRNKGKPKICEHCQSTYKEKRICWANKDHKYRRFLSDYIALCVKCHCKYDSKYNNVSRGRPKSNL